MKRLPILLSVPTMLAACPAIAQRAADLQVTYTVDAIAVAGGGEVARGYGLDNLDLIGDFDLDRLVGWNGASAHVYVLNNLGGMPNDRAGTLQGIDNIEVASHRLRLFEAWLEQGIGKQASIRAGLYDLNSEFYSSDAAGLFIAPAFGVGSEIAATGTNGPSIFPSTALAVRARGTMGDGYVQFAALNAMANTLGDPGGVNLAFDNGALLIGEAGVTHDGAKFGVGAWRYTMHQPDIYAIDGNGDPLPQVAQGLYLVAELPLGDPDKPRAVTPFVRAGVSDGRTTPFRGGWQAGLLLTHVWNSRPESQFAFGMNQGYLSHGYRQQLADQGVETLPAETAFELTYSDAIGKHLTVQPDFQLIFDRGGEKHVPAVVVGGVRFTVSL